MRLILNLDEVSFEEYNPKIGLRHAFQDQEMSSPKEGDSSNPNPFSTKEALFQAIMAINTMAEEMYKDQKKVKEESILGNISKRKGSHLFAYVLAKHITSRSGRR